VNCMEIQESDAVLDSWLMFCVFINSCCKKKKKFWAEIGAKRLNYGQNCTVRWHRLLRSDTGILANCNLDRTVRVNYGRYRYYGLKSNITA